MSISIFLGQVLGVYLFLSSIAMLINFKFYKKHILEYVIKNPALLLICGGVSFIIGLIIVVTHNIWIVSWEVVVTIIGWIILIKGLWILFFPKSISKMFIKKKKDHFGLVKWLNWICLFVGLYLIYLTFIRLPVEFMANF